MSSKESHLNISKNDLGRLQLGALIRKDVVYHDPASGTRVWEYEYEKATIRKTEWYGEARFMEEAASLRKESDGQRFGDGKVVASVPMHVWAREIAPRVKDGNQSSLKRWLNASENAGFRTFRGKV